AAFSSGMLVMPDNFSDDEVKEFFGKIWVEIGSLRQRTKALDLQFLAVGIGCCQSPFSLKNTHRLSAAKAFGQHMDQRGIDIVDRSAQRNKFGGYRVLIVAHDTHFFFGNPGRPPPRPGSFGPPKPGKPLPGNPGRPPPLPRPAACACLAKASSCLGSILDRSGIPPILPIPPPRPPSPILP